MSELLAERPLQPGAGRVEIRVNPGREADTHADALTKHLGDTQPHDEGGRVWDDEWIVVLVREVRAEIFAEGFQLRRIVLAPVEPRILAQRHARQARIVRRTRRNDDAGKRDERAGK